MTWSFRVSVELFSSLNKPGKYYSYQIEIKKIRPVLTLYQGLRQWRLLRCPHRFGLLRDLRVESLAYLVELTTRFHASVKVDQTVGDILHALVDQYPELSEAIWYANGSLADHVAVILNGRDIRHLDGVDTPLTDDDTLDLFPPVGGGVS